MSKRKKKKKPIQKQVSLKPHNYIKKLARKLPIYECINSTPWLNRGMSDIFISRKRKNGNLIVAGYVVDTFCLGLKNTLYRFDLEPWEYREFMDQIKMTMDDPIDIEPTLAFNIIYGAIEYAEDLGFDPHKDFSITEYMLDDVLSIEYIDIPFGKDGKPFYMSGPKDNSQKIINILHKNAGEGNFDYMIGIGGETNMDMDMDEDLDYIELD